MLVTCVFPIPPIPAMRVHVVKLTSIKLFVVRSKQKEKNLWYTKQCRLRELKQCQCVRVRYVVVVISRKCDRFDR